ncbi:MAG: insulinase family protein [Candidatus Protochlamydia sp.]|nr:insulinase family protein [Candidatus Protochlamydia sp.]
MFECKNKFNGKFELENSSNWHIIGQLIFSIGAALYYAQDFKLRRYAKNLCDQLPIWLWSVAFIAVTFHQSLFCQEGLVEIEEKSKIPILTPAFNQRQTAKIRLANGLEAYIISDPQAVQSGAVLTVQAGSWDDPDEYPGLAHFLEHMLFLGTEKYPIESDYDQYIRSNGGKSNAYTTNDYTLYLFTINNQAFQEGLDRFASFFKAPLFNPSGVGRELQAIDQEYAKNINNDEYRAIYVQKEISNPRHPYHRFSAGNSATLSKVSQAVLKDWYHNHYSANLMRLIVYGSAPLDTLKSWTIQDFSQIPNSKRHPLKVTLPILNDGIQQELTYIEPIRDLRSLRLTWEIPASLDSEDEFKNESVLCYILGHEGEGSLLASLKKDHLAEGIMCGGHRLGSEALILTMRVELTEEGLKEVNKVIERCFQAIKMLKEKEFPGYLFDEVKKIAILKYQFQPQEDPFEYLMTMGGLRVRGDLAAFPENKWIPTTFNPKSIQTFLSYLTPKQAAITVIAKPSELPVELEKREAWIGVSYHHKKISPEQLEKWNEAPIDPDLHLPVPNPFIPQHLAVLPLSADQKAEPSIPHPSKLIETEQGLIYFDKDKNFRIPNIVWMFEIQSPLINKESASLSVLTDLYLKCLEENLNPFYYPASLADLEYEITQEEQGILLTIKGYSDKAEVLFDEILSKLKSCKPSEPEFLLYKNQLMRGYQNFSKENALDQAVETFKCLIHQSYASYTQKAQALAPVTFRQYEAYADLLFNQTYVRGILYGNNEESHALQLWNKLQSALGSQIFPEKERFVERILVLPDTGPYSIKVNIEAPAHALVLAIEDVLFSFKTRAAQQILSQAMGSSFYSTLRTKQQTGYLLYNTAEELDKHLFTIFAVQSNSHDPKDLLARFELFIESFLREMSANDLSREKFEVIRAALLEKIKKAPQNLYDMGELLKRLAFKYDGDFDWIDKRIQGFIDLNYEEFLEIAVQFLGKENKKRVAIMIKGDSSSLKNLRYILLKTPQDLKRLSNYTHIK